MKKIALLTGALVLAFSLGVYASNSVSLFVNGNKINTEVKIINGTSYAPLRAIGEALGARVEWVSATKRINITTGSAPATANGTNKNTITLAEFNRIQKNKTYDQVKSIIGGDGELISQSSGGSGNYTFDLKMYYWEGEGNIGANANFLFQDGRLTTKSQINLE